MARMVADMARKVATMARMVAAVERVVAAGYSHMGTGVFLYTRKIAA